MVYDVQDDSASDIVCHLQIFLCTGSSRTTFWRIFDWSTKDETHQSQEKIIKDIAIEYLGSFGKVYQTILDKVYKNK